MRTRRHGTLRIGVACLLAVLVAACSGPRLRFRILFEDVRGLRVGDAVAWKGFAIGQVKAVGLAPEQKVAVDVAVEARYRDYVRTSAVFVIEPSPFSGAGEARAVVMTVLDPGAPPLAPDAVVAGSDSPLDVARRRARDAFDRLVGEIRDQVFGREAGAPGGTPTPQPMSSPAPGEPAR